jgi:hypothetical protein
MLEKKKSITLTRSPQKIKGRHAYHSYTEACICFKIYMYKKKPMYMLEKRNPQP